MIPDATEFPYIERHLVSWDKDGGQRRIAESELLSIEPPIVILGEPGMGKTRLLERLGDRTDHRFVRAAALVRNPSRWEAKAGQVLVIDALDEIAALEERDPLHNVLAMLARIGSPPFILSCRAADWRQASARRDISEDYGRPAEEWTIEQISQQEAEDALVTNDRDRDRAQALLQSMRERSLGDLIGNPLNLRLLAAFVDRPGDLPRSRAELFSRAAAILRFEHGAGRENDALAALSEDQALDAAGALMAVWLLAGREAISAARLSQEDDNDLLVAELESQVPRDRLLAVLKSRLFRSADGGARRLPLHRSLAEFLGARWLARKVSGNRQARARLISQITADNMVPASLRGLHAWLAYFDSAFLDAALAIDPFGVLRYGDTEALTVGQARKVLAALRRLNEDDPNFRAGDWSDLSAPALVQGELVPDIREIVSDPATGFQLRSLLLEAVKGSPAAALLAHDLAAFSLDTKLTYRERADAGEALVTLEDEEPRWREVIARLVDMPDESSWRLAAKMVAEAGVGHFSNAEIARVALRATGFPEAKGRIAQASFSGVLYSLEQAVPDERIEPLLDTLAETMGAWASESARDRAHWENSHELIRFARRLMHRYFELSTPKPLQLWRWLDLFERDEFYRDKRSELIALRLGENDDLRRGVQHHVLFLPGSPNNRRHKIYDLQRLSAGLGFKQSDVLFFLDEIALRGAHDDVNREAWKVLVNLSRSSSGIPDEIRQAATRFSDGDAELQDFLDPKPDPSLREWEKQDRKWERERRRDEREREKRWAEHRADYASHLEEIRQGDPNFLGTAAKVYFGLYNDIDSKLDPIERLSHWLGADLLDDLLRGFQALIDRDDLPSAQTLAESYARGQYWHVIHPIIAALNERTKSGETLDNLPTETLLRGRIGIWGEILDNTLKDDLLAGGIDEALDARPGGMEQALRLWFEPHLAAGAKHIMGLYELARTEARRPLARRLAAEWLEHFKDLPVEIERELIDAVLGAERTDGRSEGRSLSEIASARLETIAADDTRREVWLATLFLTDFDAFCETVADQVVAPSFLWSLRWVTGFQRVKGISHYSPILRQLTWLVEHFRSVWPETHRRAGVSSGDTKGCGHLAYSDLQRSEIDHSTVALVRFLVARSDASKCFEAAEEIFDEVSPAVSMEVAIDLLLPV